MVCCSVLLDLYHFVKENRTLQHMLQKLSVNVATIIFYMFRVDVA